jgi:site-specific DNA recombinase
VLHEARSGFIHYSLRDKLTLARQMVRDRLTDMIIVWDLRRFARNFVHSSMIFEEIEAHGGQVVSVNENIDNTLNGKLVRSILAWSAESEREKIMEYANRRWQSRRELGLPVGTGYSPYGWDWADAAKTTYKINVEEAAVRFSIFHMFVELDMSLRSIAHKLTEDGIPTPSRTRYPGRIRGQLWSHTTLYDFLKTPTNIGTLTICKRQKTMDERGRLHWQPHPENMVIENVLPPIIPLHLYERAQRKLAQNQVEQSHPPRDPSLHLLRSHIRCATCGQKMSTRITQRPHHQYPYYYCANRRNKYSKCPDIPVIRADLLDPLVWGECCQLFERIELIQSTIEAELQRSLAVLLEDTHGQEQTAEIRAVIEYARLERAKHPEGSYFYNLLTADIRAKTEELERFEMEHVRSRDLETYTAAYRNRILGFWEFVNVMRGTYHKATYQEKRNALDVLGVMVTYTPRRLEERKRGRDATLEEIQRRMSITYSPLFTGVRPPVEGLPQNQ